MAWAGCRWPAPSPCPAPSRFRTSSPNAMARFSGCSTTSGAPCISTLCISSTASSHSCGRACRSWVEMRMVQPSAASSRSRRVMVASERLSTPAKGSSSSMIVAPWAMHRATKARFFCPPESWPICRPANSESSTRSSASSHGSPVSLGGAAGEALVSVAAHHHHVPHGQRELPVHVLTLRDVADPALLARLCRRCAVDQHAPGVGLDHAHDGLEQRGFPGAVHADQAADSGVRRGSVTRNPARALRRSAR